MSLLKTKKDKALFAKWNKKLEKYDDCNAENYSKSEPILKEWHSIRFQVDNIPTKQRKHATEMGRNEFLDVVLPAVERMNDVRDYYLKCMEYYETGEFPSALHKKIWYYYSKAQSLREIEKSINGKIKKDAISKYIKEVIKRARSTPK